MGLLKQKRVLLVEDESLILLHLRDLIGEYGCRVVDTAANLSEGLAKAKVVDCDLALLDVELHGEKCFPIAKALLGRGVPFAFVTGYDNSVIPSKFKRFPIIHKPLTEGDLKRTLNRLLPGSNDLFFFICSEPEAQFGVLGQRKLTSSTILHLNPLYRDRLSEPGGMRGSFDGHYRQRPILGNGKQEKRATMLHNSGTTYSHQRAQLAHTSSPNVKISRGQGATPNSGIAGYRSPTSRPISG